MKIEKNGIIDIRAPQNEPTATILIGGDFCPRCNGETLILNGEAESILEPMQDVFCGNDLSILQFETVLTEQDTPIVKNGPNLKCAPGVVDFLHAWGGDVCLMANNHTGDFGEQPLLDTIEILQAQGFKTVGAGKNLKEAYKPLIVKAGDIKVGILNICENEYGGAEKKKAGTAVLNPFVNMVQIRELSEKVDCCMVVTHGGNEQYPLPSPRVASMSRAFIESGADIVVNIHPHCPQGIELYNGKPIVYSLGNFYFPWPPDRNKKNPPFWNLGYMVRFQIDKAGAFALEPIPVVFQDDGSSLDPLRGKKLKAFYAYLQKISDLILNEDQLKSYYEAWVSQSPYCKRFKEFPYTQEDFVAHNKKFCSLRNSLSCEAHCELLRTFVRLVEDGRLEKAAKNFPKIQELQDCSAFL